MEWDMPALGEVKICLRFALLPTIIGNKQIWLEFYYIEKYWSGYRWKITGKIFLYREKG